MQTVTIKIKGMTCMGCVNSARSVLEDIPGVCSVIVSLDQAHAIVQYENTKSSIEQLKQAIVDTGFEIIN